MTKKIKVEWDKILDWKDISKPPIIRWIDLGNATMFRITAFFAHSFHDGNPREGLYIGIERVGSFLFDLKLPKSTKYVAEKLNLPESDAAAIADWINAQLGYDLEQFGEYNEDYINEVEPYGLIGERFYMPLVPRIIKD